MEFLSPHLCLESGKTASAQIEEIVQNGIHAVYIRSSADVPLHSELGAVIGLQPRKLKRWMADHRHSEYWCRPAFGSALSDIPEQTQGLIWEKTDGSFGVILPVVSEQYKCVLRGCEEGLQAQLFSWYEGLTHCDTLAFLWAEGADPFALLEGCARLGVELLGAHCPVRTQRSYPELFEYLGWCSWDAFEIRVNEEDLFAKCREFQEKGIPVKWAILDDMWAEVHDFYGATYENRREMIRLMHSSRLYDFCADPIRFPNGLAHCLEGIKAYGITPGIWHPTTGYWKGIDPEGPLMQRLKDVLIETEDGLFIHSPEYDKAYHFYNTFHDSLARAGAEFVKIDNQSMSRRFFKKRMPVGRTARSFHDAMERSVTEHFGNRMINCMGMANEDMWNRSSSPISRCSDDFLPEDRAWFTKHILQCSYNCTVQGQFYFCDWDMWWTDDAQAVKNSILRAVSGGPIYVSDTLHRSRPEVLTPLIFSDGRILRCDRPAMPTADCLTVDPVSSGKLFKLQNLCSKAGILAVFDLNEGDAPVSGTITPGDIPGLAGEEFAVYEHFSKTLTILKAGESLPLTLQSSDDYRLYILVPMEQGCCIIGDAGKFISPAAVTEDGTLAEPGVLARVENRTLVLEEQL